MVLFSVLMLLNLYPRFIGNKINRADFLSKEESSSNRVVASTQVGCGDVLEDQVFTAVPEHVLRQVLAVRVALEQHVSTHLYSFLVVIAARMPGVDISATEVYSWDTTQDVSIIRGTIKLFCDEVHERGCFLRRISYPFELMSLPGLIGKGSVKLDT